MEDEKTKTEILGYCKTLMPKDIQLEDSRLSLYIDIIYQRILNFCNRHDFPEELKFTASQMAIDMIVENQTTLEGDSRISSISEGDRTVNFSVNGLMTQADEKISKLTELKKFRKLYKV